MDTQREMRVKAVNAILYCLNDAPFKPEMAGIFFSRERMAEALVDAIEQADVDVEHIKEFAV